MAAISRVLSLPAHSNYMPYPPRHRGAPYNKFIYGYSVYGDPTVDFYIQNYIEPSQIYRNKPRYSGDPLESQYKYVIKKQSDNSITNSGILNIGSENQIKNMPVGVASYYQVYTDINGSTAYGDLEYFTPQTPPDVGPVPFLVSFNSNQIVVGWNPDMSLQRWGYAPEQDRSWNVKLRRTTSGFPVVEEKIYSYGSSLAIFVPPVGDVFSGTYFVGLYPQNLSGGPRAYQASINFTIPVGPYFPYFPYFGPPIY